MKLTLRESVVRGLENNVDLAQQRNQLAVTRSNTLAQLAPHVSASADAGRCDGTSFNQQLGTVVNGQTDFIVGRLNANLPFFGGFAQLNPYRQAQNQNEAQLQAVGRTRLDVMRNAAFQYLTWLLNQQLVRNNRQQVETQQAHYDQIAVQLALGSPAEADQFNQENRVRKAELLLVRSTNRFKNEWVTLAQALLFDPTIV